MRTGPPSPPQLDQYGRLPPVASDDSLRAMEYETSYEVRRPTFGDRIKQWLERARDEWRILAIIILLITICFLLGDLDVSVHWKLASEYEPTLSYPLLKAAFDEHSSFMSFYTLPTDANALFLEVPMTMLSNGTESPPVIFSATYARGSWDDSSSVLLLHEPAESTDHVVFTFNMTSDGSGVDVIRKQHGVRTTSADDKLAVDMGAVSSRVTTLPVVIENLHRTNKSVVLDASPLISKGFFITDVAAATDSRLRLDLCRSFPNNFDISAEYLVLTDPADPASLVDELITFSIALLPEEPMIGRAADERVGFFYLGYMDIGDHRNNPNFTSFFTHESDLVDTNVKVINRRRIKSGDDQKPISYYIDPTVPPKWRESFKQGVEAWRPAFEAAGFGPEAIRAVLPDDEDWPEDYQVGDLRYSSISWVVDLDSTFALGPSVVDPRSGEILKSDIIFTHGWVKHWIAYIENIDVSKDPTATGMNALDPERDAAELRELLGLPKAEKDLPHHHHHHHDHDHDHDHEHEKDDAFTTRRRGKKARGLKYTLRHHRHGKCQEARAKFDLSPQLARLALEASGKMVVTDDIIMAGIKDVIMHEVGHTLGLRHNFKASSAVTWDEAQNLNYTSAHGLSTSVMDYLPLNVISGRGQDQKVDYFSPVIGSYDMMAIKYGYGEIANERAGMPHDVLTAVADQNLAFATDEDDSSNLGPDPYVTVFDFTADPARFYLDRLDLVSELRPTLLDRAVWVGDEFSRYAAAETTLLKTVFSAGNSLTKFIGGYTVTRARRAAVGVVQEPPLAPLSTAEQQKALTGILRILTDNGDILPQAEALPYMLQKTGSCSGLYQYCLGRSPVDLIKVVDDSRGALLRTLMAAPRLERLRTADWILTTKDEPSLSVGNLFQQISDALWGPTLAASALTAESRNWDLQLYWVELLLEYAGSTPKELSREIAALAAAQLFLIQDSVEQALNAGTVTAADESYPLLKSVLVRLRANNYVKGNA